VRGFRECPGRKWLKPDDIDEPHRGDAE